MLLTAVLGELRRAADGEATRVSMKAFEQVRDYSIAGIGSAWAKDGDTIISVGSSPATSCYGGVYRLQLRCRSSACAASAARAAPVRDGQRWRLEGYRETRFEDRRRRARRRPRTMLTTGCRPSFLGLAVIEPRTAAVARRCLRLIQPPAGQRSRNARRTRSRSGRASRAPCVDRDHRRARRAVRLRARCARPARARGRSSAS